MGREKDKKSKEIVKRRKVMKEFFSGFSSRYWTQRTCRCLCRLGNYFNIQANIVRLVTVLLFLSSTEIGIITVTLYAYLAGWLGNEPLGDGAKKAEIKLFSYLLFV